jgi:hypothetical protein
MKYIKIFEDFNPRSIRNVEELENKLKEYSIPTEEWGTGEAKTIEHLFDELNNDECNVEDKGGYLIRSIEFVGIIIYYKDKDNNTWILKEDKQEFKDGRVRRRDIKSSVSEKMKFGEDPSIAAIRGIEEELGVEISREQLTKMRDLYYNGGSQSYPGLRTKYKGHQFTCFFNHDQFDENGYIEVQKDKSTFFKWSKKDI